jgi:hypothetical protein
MTLIAQEIADKWVAQGLSKRPGASAEQIAEFEQRYSVLLPSDFRAYLQLVDGMNEAMDDESFRFWPLAEIQPVDQVLEPIHTDRYWYPGCFIFADYLTWCWAYAIRLAGASSEVGNIFHCVRRRHSPAPIAGSFSEFAERYIRNPDSLLPP